MIVTQNPLQNKQMQSRHWERRRNQVRYCQLDCESELVYNKPSPTATFQQTVFTAGGTSYIRWGRRDCPSTSSLVYAGRAAGAFFVHRGGGSNYLCLTDNPDFLNTTPGHQGLRSHLYGAEYQADANPPAFASMTNHNVPCALCHTPTRGSTIMIPGRTTCEPTWTREYYGYLMADYLGHFRTTYECVDMNAESLPGSALSTDGALFYFTEAVCNGIDCPPYTAGAELTCVVCTK